MSFLFLSYTFCPLDIGAVVIVLAVLISKMGDNSESSGDNKFLFNMVFCFSQVPAALSGILKEFTFRSLGPDQELSVSVMQLCVAVFQCIGNFLFVWVYALPILGPSSLPLSAMPGNMVHGFRCLMGENTAVPPACNFSASGGGPHDDYFPGLPRCDDCSQAGWVTAVYMFWNVLYNILMLLLLRHGSASFFFLLNAAKLPVTDVLFASPLVMGEGAARPLEYSDGVSLVVVMVGLSFYRQGGKKTKELQKQRRVMVPDEGKNNLQQPLLGDPDEVCSTTKEGASTNSRQLLLFSIGPMAARYIEPLVEVESKVVLAKTSEQIRAGYIIRLGGDLSPSALTSAKDSNTVNSVRRKSIHTPPHNNRDGRVSPKSGNISPQSSDGYPSDIEQPIGKHTPQKNNVGGGSATILNNVNHGPKPYAPSRILADKSSEVIIQPLRGGVVQQSGGSLTEMRRTPQQTNGIARNRFAGGGLVVDESGGSVPALSTGGSGVGMIGGRRKKEKTTIAAAMLRPDDPRSPHNKGAESRSVSAATLGEDSAR